MSRFGVVIFFVIILCMASCTVHDPSLTHKLFQYRAISYDTKAYQRLLVDINNDGSEDLVTSVNTDGSTGTIFTTNRYGKPLSQIDVNHYIRSLVVLTNPRDNKKWIFYSFNDGQNVYLKASNYVWGANPNMEEKNFQHISRIAQSSDNPRNEYDGVITPRYIEDMDGDGSMEVICVASSGFEANPRGICVYNLDSGIMEWYKRFPANVNSLILKDLDSNGSIEVLFSTIASKNTDSILNDVDDSNIYWGVLDHLGNSIFVDKIAEGYGMASLAIEDIDHDGNFEIFRFVYTWGSLQQQNSLTINQFKSGRLLRLKEYAVPETIEKIESGLFVHRLDRRGTVAITLIDQKAGLVVLDKDLNKIEHKFVGWIKNIYETTDINNDGDTEFLVRTEDNYFAVLDNTFRTRARIKNPFPDDLTIDFKTISNSFGDKLDLMIATPSEALYYEYKHGSLIDQIKGLLHDNHSIIILLLFIFSAVAWGLYKIYRKVGMRMADSLDLCYLKVTRNNRIYFTNRLLNEYIVANGFNDANSTSDNLEILLPELSTALASFMRANLVKVRMNTILKLINPNFESKVYIFKTGIYPERYRIIIFPPEHNNDKDTSQIAWAETARRLAHNVRRHINNVILAMEPLSEFVDGQNNASKYVKIINNEIEQIRVFTHAFQRFTELKDYELKIYDVVPSIEHCLSKLVIPNGIHVIKSWNNSSVEALIEPIRFEEAIMNLLTNALEALRHNGVLHITVKAFPLHSSPKGDLSVLVEIEDDGIGIQRVHLDDIWKPFFTTKEHGTGIGIPESKKIIESMHGNLDIQSEEGKGTIVSIWLRGV